MTRLGRKQGIHRKSQDSHTHIHGDRVSFPPGSAAPDSREREPIGSRRRPGDRLTNTRLTLVFDSFFAGADRRLRNHQSWRLEAQKLALTPHAASLHAHSAAGTEGGIRWSVSRSSPAPVCPVSQSLARHGQRSPDPRSIIIDFPLIHCFDCKSPGMRMPPPKANKQIAGCERWSLLGAERSE